MGPSTAGDYLICGKRSVPPSVMIGEMRPSILAGKMAFSVRTGEMDKGKG